MEPPSIGLIWLGLAVLAGGLIRLIFDSRQRRKMRDVLNAAWQDYQSRRKKIYDLSGKDDPKK